MIGVDPCSESLRRITPPTGAVRLLKNGSSRRIVQITDLDEEKPVSINDTLSFALLDESESAVGIIVLGRNVTESLEVFEKILRYKLR